ncbi:hypothetical protein SAMN05192569_10635 [Parageobacillus thermantarcticus]|uniref:Uncharacterized protein n=1 Tax=Parageobacillus thermantarcticus TaxID=186116 RepID=A0A1I0TUZ0_9BACL|nr:hypothetical protein [Parageobacillus thermantarcticus]SFA55527.1 hypothetical protein SAMN05192569_10635 [Parageobacillus thermantarcticus]
MNSKTKELLQLLQDHPDRELIFMYPEEGSDHYYTLGQPKRIILDEYTIVDDTVWFRFDNQDELFDHIAEEIAERHFSEFPLSEEQNEWVNQQAKKRIEQLEWKKAIVVYIEPA